jgi:hypothetical protein
MLNLMGSDGGVKHSESLGLWTLSIVRNSKLENTTFRKLDLFPSSDEGRETYSVGSLRKSHTSNTGEPSVI